MLIINTVKLVWSKIILQRDSTQPDAEWVYSTGLTGHSGSINYEKNCIWCTTSVHKGDSIVIYPYRPNYSIFFQGPHRGFEPGSGSHPHKETCNKLRPESNLLAGLIYNVTNDNVEMLCRYMFCIITYKISGKITLKQQLLSNSLINSAMSSTHHHFVSRISCKDCTELEHGKAGNHMSSRFMDDDCYKQGGTKKSTIPWSVASNHLIVRHVDDEVLPRKPCQRFVLITVIGA